jgi:membrane protein
MLALGLAIAAFTGMLVQRAYPQDGRNSSDGGGDGRSKGKGDIRRSMNMRGRGPLNLHNAKAGIGTFLIGTLVIALTHALYPKAQRWGLASKSVAPRARDSRGRRANRPGEIPAPGWKDIAWRVYGGVQRDRVLLVAAGVTYYALLALFPATGAVVSLYGLFADPGAINEHVNALSGLLPAGAIEVVGDQAKRIASHGQSTLGVAFIVSLALSLWGANAGTKSLFDALNIIYKEEEKRSFIRLTLASLAFTFGGIVLVMLGVGATVVIPVLLHLFGIANASSAWLLSLSRWPIVVGAALFGLACLYRYGPSRREPKWRWVTWGSAWAAGVWLVGSILFSWYVANFGTYNTTYGSLGAMVGAMVWMWLSSIVVLLGAEINAEIEHQTVKDSTKGARKPLGVRGARMADTVGEMHH